MAILAGYLISEQGSSQEISDHLPTVLADVFIHDMQDYGELWFSQFDAKDFFQSIPEMPKTRANDLPMQPSRRLLAANQADGPAGERVGRYSDDFYHRIHVTPPALYLGNLISTQFRTIEIWNGYFTDQSLTNVQTLNGDGLIVTPPVGTPYEIKALQSLVYDVSIFLDGPPAVDATIRWTVEGVDYDADITGSRVIPLPMEPNWERPVKETLEWKTDVIFSYDGTEQRSAIRSKPRRYQEYYYTLTNLESQRIENLLWGWQFRRFAVPHWSEITILRDNIIPGQTTILTDTDNYHYTVGGLIFISDGLSYEMQEIESVTSGVITLSKGADGNWNNPILIAPVNLAKIDGDMNAKLKRETADVTSMNMQFMHDAITTDPWIPTGSSPANTYLSDELLLTEPNWKDGISAEFETDANVLDFDTGAFALSPRRGFPYIVQEYEWLFKNRAELTEFRKFLERRNGRMHGFWMPTWKKDFTLSKLVTSGATGFQVDDNFYGLMVDGAEGRKHVMILLKNGTYILKEISSAGYNDIDPTKVDVVTTAVIGEDFTPNDVKIACIMAWYRLNNDRVTINYLDKNVATVKLSLVSVMP